jgi:putative ABC transport system permease protein
VFIGEALGALGVLGISKLAADLFYGVSPRDPVVVGSVATFLFTVSMFAGILPAWRAASCGAASVLRPH